MESPYLVLYKISNNEMFYWRLLEQNKKSVIIYKGKVGELGDTVIFEDRLFSSLRKKFNKELIDITSNGYRKLEEDDYNYVHIEYDIVSDECNVNSQYYSEVKKCIENILLNTGLGFTIFDEFEMYNEGILEVTCQVVNHNMAIEVLEKALRHSKFSDYKKIYEYDFR